MTDETNIIFPSTKQISIGEETLTLTPIKFGQLPKALLIVQRIGALLIEHVKDNTIQTPVAMLEIAALGGEDLIQLVAFGVGKPREWFDTLDADTGLEILISFVEVNLDFFTKRVLPMLNSKVEELNLVISQVTQR